MMRQRTEHRAPRPVRAAPAALSKMLSRAWSLPPRRNFIAIERNLRVPMALDPPPELVAAVVHVGPHDFSIQSPSELVISQATGKEAAHA
jgi:hypothetical protein